MGNASPPYPFYFLLSRGLLLSDAQENEPATRDENILCFHRNLMEIYGIDLWNRVDGIRCILESGLSQLEDCKTFCAWKKLGESDSIELRRLANNIDFVQNQNVSLNGVWNLFKHVSISCRYSSNWLKFNGGCRHTSWLNAIFYSWWVRVRSKSGHSYWNKSNIHIDLVSLV